jgi:hypothetical protein
LAFNQTIYFDLKVSIHILKAEITPRELSTSLIAISRELAYA